MNAQDGLGAFQIQKQAGIPMAYFKENVKYGLGESPENRPNKELEILNG